jgi:uridine phosphorylase
MALRKGEGCLAVEMEAAAIFTVARFRNVKLAQILYSGDTIDGEQWEHRGWHTHWGVRKTLVDIAAEACLR